MTFSFMKKFRPAGPSKAKVTVAPTSVSVPAQKKRKAQRAPKFVDLGEDSDQDKDCDPDEEIEQETHSDREMIEDDNQVAVNSDDDDDYVPDDSGSDDDYEKTDADLNAEFEMKLKKNDKKRYMVFRDLEEDEQTKYRKDFELRKENDDLEPSNIIHTKRRRSSAVEPEPTPTPTPQFTNDALDDDEGEESAVDEEAYEAVKMEIEGETATAAVADDASDNGGDDYVEIVSKPPEKRKTSDAVTKMMAGIKQKALATIAKTKSEDKTNKVSKSVREKQSEPEKMDHSTPVPAVKKKKKSKSGSSVKRQLLRNIENGTTSSTAPKSKPNAEPEPEPESGPTVDTTTATQAIADTVAAIRETLDDPSAWTGDLDQIKSAQEQVDKCSFFTVKQNLGKFERLKGVDCKKKNEKIYRVSEDGDSPLIVAVGYSGAHGENGFRWCFFQNTKEGIVSVSNKKAATEHTNFRDDSEKTMYFGRAGRINRWYSERLGMFIPIFQGAYWREKTQRRSKKKKKRPSSTSSSVAAEEPKKKKQKSKPAAVPDTDTDAGAEIAPLDDSEFRFDIDTLDECKAMTVADMMHQIPVVSWPDSEHTRGAQNIDIFLRRATMQALNGLMDSRRDPRQRLADIDNFYFGAFSGEDPDRLNNEMRAMSEERAFSGDDTMQQVMATMVAVNLMRSLEGRVLIQTIRGVIESEVKEADQQQ